MPRSESRRAPAGAMPSPSAGTPSLHWVTGPPFSRDECLRHLIALSENGPVSSVILERSHGQLYRSLRYHFGSIVEARRAAGLALRPRSIPQDWSRALVLKEIRRVHERGEPLAMSRAPTNLVRAGRRHFGSWRQAIEAAGLRYEDVRLGGSWPSHGRPTPGANAQVDTLPRARVEQSSPGRHVHQGVLAPPASTGTVGTDLLFTRGVTLTSWLRACSDGDTRGELLRRFKWAPSELEDVLAQLVDSGQAQQIGERYFATPADRLPPEADRSDKTR